MTEAEFREAVVAELQALRQAAAELAAAMRPQEPPVEEAPAWCLHPEDVRVDFSGQGTEEWDCRVCGHQHRVVLAGAAK